MKDAPKDPTLFLTIFVALCLPVILGTWFLTPEYYIEREEGEEAHRESIVNMNLVLPPDKLFQKTDEAIQIGQAALSQLEGEEDQKSAGNKSEKKKAKGK